MTTTDARAADVYRLGCAIGEPGPGGNAGSAYTDLAALLGRAEDLDPELACCETQSAIGTVIKHPLLFAVPYAPMMNAMLNKAFRAKKVAVEEATADRRWEHYL